MMCNIALNVRDRSIEWFCLVFFTDRFSVVPIIVICQKPSYCCACINAHFKMFLQFAQYKINKEVIVIYTETVKFLKTLLCLVLSSRASHSPLSSRFSENPPSKPPCLIQTVRI